MTFPVAISSAANKVVVPCRTWSWVAFSANPRQTRQVRQDRQDRRGPVQGLNLGLRAPRGAALPDGGERTPSLVCRSRLGKLRAA